MTPKGKAKLDKKEVAHIGRLAKLPLSNKEITKFQSQLSEILNYIDYLSQAKTQAVKPTNQVTGLENVTRVDQKNKSCLSTKEALSNAPETYQGFFKVKGVFEEK